MRKKPPAFPVGLYGMLLFALCWLTFRGVFAPIERVLVGGCCSITRLWAGLFGTPALAATEPATERLSAAADLDRRLRDHAVPINGDRWLSECVAVHCAVVAVSRRGGGGEMCELRLDHTYAELAGCRDFVTKGESLVGFLPRPGDAAASDDEPDDMARVLLANHPLARALHGELDTADGGRLRVVVRAAATVDPAPLKVDLWDDPYRAARLDRGGLRVLSREVSASESLLPGGLLLGTTRIWGYPRTAGGDALTLGVFIAPAIAPRALSHVVLWRRRTATTLPEGSDEATTRRRGRSMAAMVHELPGATNGRHLLVGAADVVDGAAVLQDGYLLGTARGLAFGVGLVTSFAASRQRWTLIWLPDDGALSPIELHAEVIATDGDRVVLRRLAASVPGANLHPTAGHLFTGSNGLHCPSGLWIGRVSPHPLDFDKFVVDVQVERGQRAVAVLSGGGK